MELRPYQRRAVEHLLHVKRGGLFLPMGAGKTAITLSALPSGSLPALVVAPKRPAQAEWPREASKWAPELRVAVVVGSKRQRAAAWAQEADLYVTTWDLLADALLSETPTFGAMIFDELSGYKRESTSRWKNAMQLVRLHQPEDVWGLTGTPVGTGVADLWAETHLCDGGASLPGKKRTFLERFFTPGPSVAELRHGHVSSAKQGAAISGWTPKPGAFDEIMERVRPRYLAMAEEDILELPDLLEVEVPVPLDGAAEKAYQGMARRLVAELPDDGAPVAAASAAGMMTKLMQINAGFVFDESGAARQIHTARIDAVREIVDGTDSPVLVVVWFRPERDALLEAFGDRARLASEPGVEEVWNRGEVPVLIAQPQSVGRGMNFQHGGHTMVWMTKPWSSELWEQMNRRLLRPGQQHKVTSFILRNPGSIDDRVRDVLAGRASVSEAVTRHLKEDVGAGVNAAA